MIIYKTQQMVAVFRNGANSIYEEFFIRKPVHSNSTKIAPHRPTLLTTMEHAGHAKLYQMWSN
jgi:hypothetical protein